MSHRKSTIGKLFSYKDWQSLLHSSGVLYQLTFTVVLFKTRLGKPSVTSLHVSMIIDV